MGVQPLDPQGFSTHRISRLRHDFNHHPLFQLPALYNVEAIPRYRALLEAIIDGVRATIEREQPGIFNVTGYIFISAPPSVTGRHRVTVV
jgi:hypothetical protein